MALRTLSLFPDVSGSLFSDRFNRIDRLFSQLTGDSPLSATPSYDIRMLGDNRYGITLSVPGWKEDELEIKTAGGRLTVTGKREEKSESEEEGWLHQGISRADFNISYSLPEHVKVQGAALENGLLTVELYQEIPESEKPQKIAIESRGKAIEHQA